MPPSKSEVMQQIGNVLDANCEDPATEMINLGEVLVKIGKALQGQSLADARAIVKAVSALHGVDGGTV